jgi:hypothetical protein
MVKVTDLEKFALEQIFRPYQSMVAELGEKRLTELPMHIDAIPMFAKQNPLWWELVKDRLIKMNVWFPVYIKHQIVEMMRPARTQSV